MFNFVPFRKKADNVNKFDKISSEAGEKKSVLLGS